MNIKELNKIKFKEFVKKQDLKRWEKMTKEINKINNNK